MEPEGSLPFPQEPPAGPYPEPDSSSPHPPTNFPKSHSNIIFHFLLLSGIELRSFSPEPSHYTDGGVPAIQKFLD
jgi:hypothetical protein